MLAEPRERQRIRQNYSYCVVFPAYNAIKYPLILCLSGAKITIEDYFHSKILQLYVEQKLGFHVKNISELTTEL